MVTTSTIEDRHLQNVYILLDRNPKHIHRYEEAKTDSTFIRMIPRSWTFIQREEEQIDWREMEAYYHLEEGIRFVSYKKFHAGGLTIEKKPLSFLDSIRLFDIGDVAESWLLEKGGKYVIGEHWFGQDTLLLNGKGKIFLLDKSTIRNDSIVMYEVEIRHYIKEIGQ